MANAEIIFKECRPIFYPSLLLYNFILKSGGDHGKGYPFRILQKNFAVSEK